MHNTDNAAGTNPVKVVPIEVKHSDYGCPNCLWYAVECKDGSKYAEKKKNGKLICSAYMYCD